jgi:hypothetical protein
MDDWCAGSEETLDISAETVYGDLARRSLTVKTGDWRKDCITGERASVNWEMLAATRLWTRSDGSYWLHLRSNVERWCQQCDTCTESQGPQTGGWGLMH